MITEVRALLGEVAVDSGQLLIIDPCYIEREWKKEEDSNVTGVKFWGSKENEAIQFLKAKGYIIEETDSSSYIKTDNKETVNTICDQLATTFGHFNGLVWSVINDSSYNEVCNLTSNENRHGQFKDIIGCAFQSGFGDGKYEVYGTYKNFGIEGIEDIRISKVEIILIEDEV